MVSPFDAEISIAYCPVFFAIPDKILFFESKDNHEGRLLKVNFMVFWEESLTITLYTYFLLASTRLTIVDVKDTLCALLKKALIN